MDEIYDEMENYNDENTLLDMQNENIKLKSQVQKMTLDIENMQKDFDKLASEHKKLEINYSSLLKTARAEIERKTQMLNNLNMEKDILVLNTIQNNNKNISVIRRNMSRDRANSFKKNRKGCDSDGVKSNNSKDMQESKKFDSSKNRNEANRLPSIDTVSSSNTDETNKLLNVKDKETKLESFNEDNGESKENLAKDKFQAQNIRNRRKSMPVASKYLTKFSSDEEFDDYHSPENANRKDRIPKDDKSRRVIDRNCNDKKSRKVSETSGFDEKYSNYRESRDTSYNSKHNRYSDKYRTVREKYDPLQRYRKHFSPERSHRRMPRDYLEEHHLRHRVLESPPLERYDSQNKRKDRRPNYDRENPEERYMKRRYETHVFKHKTQSDYDEPNSKRVRRYSINKHPEEDIKQHEENDILDRPVIFKQFENFQDISCQSPDYIHPDTELNHPIREIMDTAATHLEDPRLTSKKYITKTEDNKVILSTVDGRNVDLQVIDTSTWNIPRVDIPEALQQPPGYEREVYMGIDNPVSNLSMESGEIHSEAIDEPLLDIITESYLSDYENERNSQSYVRDLIVGVQQEKIESLLDSENSGMLPKCNNTKNAEIYVNDNKSSNVLEVIVDKQEKELENVVIYTNVPRYKISTNNSSGNDKEKESKSKKCTARNEPTLDLQKTKPHGSENELSSQKVTKEHVIDEQIKETKKSKLTKCKILKNTESYLTDKVSEKITQKDAKQHTLNVKQKDTENLLNIGMSTKTNKYKIPKAKKPDMYTVSQTVDDAVVKPLARLLDEYHSTTKADKKCQENTKKSNKCDANKLSSVQNVDKPIDYKNENQYNDLGDEHYISQIKDQKAFREVVQGDLELSDETSDNVEMNTLKTQGKSEKFECITISSLEQTERTKREDDPKKLKTEESINTIKIKIKRVSEEKTKEPISECSKKQKTKKKTHRHKGTSVEETFKGIDVDETTDNDIPKQEVTPKEIKAKFTDLFGDSSSLITPEDLGVITAPTQALYPDKYVSIFEDAQDATDVKAENICKSQISSINASNNTTKVEETKIKKDQRTNSAKTIKGGTENKKKKSMKSDIDKLVPIVDTVETPNIIVNVLPEAGAKEPDVVNTVIISTGVQPRMALEQDVEPQINNNLVNDIRSGLNHNDFAARIQQLPLALATSTPYKELKNVHCEAESKVPESSSSSSDNKVVDVSSPPADQASISNGLDSQNNTDVPDVRIFVRRRRKVVKK